MKHVHSFLIILLSAQGIQSTNNSTTVNWNNASISTYRMYENSTDLNSNRVSFIASSDLGVTDMERKVSNQPEDVRNYSTVNYSTVNYSTVDLSITDGIIAPTVNYNLQRKIYFYKNLDKKIWKIWSPVLLGRSKLIRKPHK